MMNRRAFTLVEMIVSMFILGIIGTIAVSVIVKSMRNNATVEAQSLVHREVSNGLDRFTRVARSATQILEVTSTNFKIRGYPDTDDVAPSEINFFVKNSNSIHYTVIAPGGTAPNYTYNQANAKEYTLITKISTPTTPSPVFQYYDANNALLSAPTIAAVKAVGINVNALDSTGYLTSPTSQSTIVNLRNFKTNL